MIFPADITAKKKNKHFLVKKPFLMENDVSLAAKCKLGVKAFEISC
jgi:hypothetical protein